MKKTDPPIVVEQEYPCSAQKLWDALTIPELMREWFFDNIPDFRAEVGFKTDFPVQSGDRVFHHYWTVTEADAPHLLVYNWRYPDFPGDSYVRFEVSGDDDCAKLRFIETTVESFPQDIPEFQRESCEGGWDYFLRQRLLEYLTN